MYDEARIKPAEKIRRFFAFFLPDSACLIAFFAKYDMLYIVSLFSAKEDRLGESLYFL